MRNLFGPLPVYLSLSSPFPFFSSPYVFLNRLLRSQSAASGLLLEHDGEETPLLCLGVHDPSSGVEWLKQEISFFFFFFECSDRRLCLTPQGL